MSEAESYRVPDWTPRHQYPVSGEIQVSGPHPRPCRWEFRVRVGPRGFCCLSLSPFSLSVLLLSSLLYPFSPLPSLSALHIPLSQGQFFSHKAQGKVLEAE